MFWILNRYNLIVCQPMQRAATFAQTKHEIGFTWICNESEWIKKGNCFSKLNLNWTRAVSIEFSVKKLFLFAFHSKLFSFVSYTFWLNTICSQVFFMCFFFRYKINRYYHRIHSHPQCVNNFSICFFSLFIST